jgi:acetyl esterase/lipase
VGQVHIGINLEFVRHEDRPFEWGVEKAAELGYEYVEPMVHWGRELLSEAGYFHSVSMLDDPYRVKRACEKARVKLSGLSSHTPLCRPEIGTEYLKQEHYWKRSPLSLVGNVTTPTMLLTGEDDHRTPMSESEQLYQALKLRKIDTALVRVPGAPHHIGIRPSHLMAKAAYVLQCFKTHRQEP